MPEYLAPGVYVEETSFRNKTIEGVSTSTAAFVGPTRFGPTDGLPEMLTNFADFERIYGSIDPLIFGDVGERINHIAQSVRAFFDNGGKRLYVSRAYIPPTARPGLGDFDPPPGHAHTDLNLLTSMPGSLVTATDDARIIARYPGRGGNIQLTFTIRRGQNALDVGPRANPGGVSELRGIRQHDIVVVNNASGPIDSMSLFRARKVLGATTWGLYDDSDTLIRTAADSTLTDVRVINFSVEARFESPEPRPGGVRTESWENLSFHPQHERAYQRYFGRTLATREQELTIPFYVMTRTGAAPNDAVAPIATLQLLLSQPLQRGIPGVWTATAVLSGGDDGSRPVTSTYTGTDAGNNRKSGLLALEDVADVSIVAAPGSSDDTQTAVPVALELIRHAEQMRYRIAVIDAPDQTGVTGVRQFRARFDSKYAALYYPWVRIIDTVTDREIDLPPSGFVTGIYARNDVEHGVHKAPANEVVRDAIGFEISLNTRQQDALNPEGINCFRFFEGRGMRLWGARLATSDPEWKYVNLRRYFAYVERSVDIGTQWVVFENNSELLWANVRSTVEDFLFNEWKSGRLMGVKSEEAYFVRCDRSTMTQNDIDNGRLICLIGIAPMRPAEFVIFRIGQWTASTPVPA
jgi:phage tail sheath protein FI